jgi:flagellar biosynthesis GTPase FlhF
LPALQSTASAQTSPDTQADKTSKHKKSKKAKAEATSSETSAPAVADEKTSKAKKSKKSAAEMTSSGTASRAQTSASPSTAPAPVKNATPAETQAAKSSGQVWVNTETGVYHKGGKWFGATKQGKFMSEQDAVKSGYRAAKNEK